MMPRNVLRLALPAALVATLASRHDVSAQAPAPYGSILAERNLMIPTRDGKRMATDVYRPARNGVAVNERFPVLLQRTPYDKTKAHMKWGGSSRGRGRRCSPTRGRRA